MDEGRWLKSGFRPRRERERAREREREGERESECRHEGETLKILFSGASACGARAQRAHKHAYMGNVTTCFCDLLHSRFPVPMLRQVLVDLCLMLVDFYLVLVDFH